MIQARRPTIVVVGTGMAGAKVVEEILVRAPDRFTIRMFGAEPHGTYNRILLSTYLGGFQDPARIWLNPLEWYEQRGVFVHAGVKADTIDRKSQVVVGAGGKVAEPYDLLVLATGYGMSSDPESYEPGTIVGREGFDLSRFFNEHGLQAYESVAIPRLPNRWMLVGPYSWTGTGWHCFVEMTADHAVRAITEAGKRGATTVVSSTSGK